MGSCMICKSNAVINRQDSASRTIYNCPACGIFVVSDLVDKEVRKHSAEVCSYLMSRRLSNSNDIVLISFEKANLDKDYLQLTVEQIVDFYPRDFTEQMDKALINLEHMSEFAGDEVKIEDLTKAPLFYVKKANFKAFSFFIKSMQKAGLIDVNFYGESFFPCGIVIEPKGWERLAELKRGTTRQGGLFACVSRVDDSLHDSFVKASKKAAKECGLSMTDNASVSAEPRVCNELAVAIRASKVFVCDLTVGTPESYYCLAMAQTMQKICVLTCHKSQQNKLIVDPMQYPVVIWEKQDRLYLEILSAIQARI